ncbi:unnamed protein product, partial [Musa acuminata var. zebrina]
NLAGLHIRLGSPPPRPKSCCTRISARKGRSLNSHRLAPPIVFLTARASEVQDVPHACEQRHQSQAWARSILGTVSNSLSGPFKIDGKLMLFPIVTKTKNQREIL